MVRAIPFNANSPPIKKAKVDTVANPKRDTPPKNNNDPLKAVADSASATRPFLFPPPPPPPPPPVDNPYYQKFVQEYWNKYDGSYSSLPTMPDVPVVNLTIPSQPTTKAVKSKKLRKKEKRPDRVVVPTPMNPPPISLSQEFPINIDRTTYFIGDPTADLNALSAKSCYIRSRLLELFTTLPTEDCKFKGKHDESKAIPLRVGLRCVYCASQPLKSRAERSVCYPSSISRLYGTVADMQHKHLDFCQLIPPRVRANIHQLKNTVPREWLEKNLGPKQYYEASAKGLGMEDIEGDKAGIRLAENHKLIVKTVESVNELFVPMSKDKKIDSPVKGIEENNLEEEDSEDAAEKNIEKTDHEVEEILAQL